jgi:hypothetical protein
VLRVLRWVLVLRLLRLLRELAREAPSQASPLVVSPWSVAHSLLEILHRAGVRLAQVLSHNAVW